jgi:hypothetical protein
MNQIVAIITGLHVLAHSILGCCLHHGEHLRSAAVPSGSDYRIKYCECSTGPDDACHDHRHSAGLDNAFQAVALAECAVGESHSSPQPTHQCPHASCQWLCNEATQASALISLYQCPALSELVTVPTQSAINEVHDAEHGHKHFLALPLRLHLALGVLVI